MPRRIEPAYLKLYRTEPDYERPLLQVPEPDQSRIRKLLARLYGDGEAHDCYREVERLMGVFYAHKTLEQIEDDRNFDRSERFDETHIILTTYGDLIVSDDELPLETLHRILDAYARYVTTVHVLPFFPYSSDRGFAVIDHELVDPNLGSWEEIERLATRFELMFDGVVNHVSSRSRWFQEYVNGNPRHQDDFIGFSTREEVSEDHLRLILRPRASDLLTRVQTIEGPRYVWTTFSADQIDLNYQNPGVLVRMVEILLFYARQGADMIRLDAATYLWHELGTRSAHLEETHAIIQLFRAVLDVVAPRVALVTETNVPHADNISYLGDGSNEAQMVYNFALPPLVVLTFQSGDSTHLSRWVDTLVRFSDTATYLNFLDSHDGIGLLPIRDIVPPDEVAALIARCQEHGGLVSYRVDDHGRRTPYEVNITWWSVLNRADAGESLELQVNRFVASRSIALVLQGVPALYLVGAVGSENDLEAVSVSGDARTINRTALDAQALIDLLEDRDSRTARIVRRVGRLLARRSRCPAFHPNGDQRVLDKGSGLFCLLRLSPGGQRAVIAAVNVTDQPQQLRLDPSDLAGRETDFRLPWSPRWRDLISDRSIEASPEHFEITLGPYQVLWLQPLRNGPED